MYGAPEEFAAPKRGFKYLRFEVPVASNVQCPTSKPAETVPGATRSSDVGFVGTEFSCNEVPPCVARALLACESSTDRPTDGERGIRRRGRPKGVKDAQPRKRRTHQEIILMAPTARSKPCTSVKLAARWESLPSEVLARIFSFVLCDAVLSCVCMSWRDVIRSKMDTPSTSTVALEMRID
jgi:hypothetical protein